MFNLAQEIRSHSGDFVCKTRILWKSRTNCTYLETLPGETSDLPSPAVLSQQSVVRDCIRHSGSSVKAEGVARVAWGMYKTALVAVLQKMT